MMPDRPFFLRLGFALAALLAWSVPPTAKSSPDNDWRWFKGNLHTHTINSDGDSTPDAVARWYKEHRYQFLVLSDHNYLTEPEGLNSVFAAKDKFLLIAGEEVTANYDRIPVHVNAFEVRETIQPATGGSVLETLQNNVDLIRKSGAMPSLNHPNFRWAITPDDLTRVSSLKLFEVYNGHPGVHNSGGGGSPGLDEVWDIALTAGRKLFGIAVDDAHFFKVWGPEYSNPGRGWICVKARELSSRSVLDALDQGEFYASTGVELEEMERRPDRLRIKIKQRDDFKYTTEFIGQNGRVLTTSLNNDAEYRLQPGDRYVRAQVTDSKGDQAWVQPVFAE
jgi:hypothetical protein